MATNKVPTLDGSGKVRDKHLPDRLGATALSATYVPQWKPATAYTAGQPVVNPSGDVVTSKADHTSGTTFTAANWNSAPAVAAKLDKTEAAATYGKVGAVSSPAAAAALVHKLQSGAEPAIITAMGDSTGAMAGSWLNGLIAKLATAFPKYTLMQRNWNDTDQRYDATSTVQTGANGIMRLVTAGASTDRFFTIADSAATSPTGDLDLRFKVKIPAFGGAIILGGKYDTTTNNRGWFVQIDPSGYLQLFFSTDGSSATQLTRTSNSTIPASLLNTTVWLRIVFDVDNGASGNDFKTYYSTDNVSWTQFGTTITNTGIQSVFDSNAATQFIGRSGAGNSTGGAVEYYAFQLRSGIGNNVRPVIDLDVALWNGFGSNARAGGANIAQFTDFVGNTVQIDGTGQGGTMTGSPCIFFLNGCVSGSAISYASDSVRFPKLTPIQSDLCFINYSHNEGGTVYYRTVFKQLADNVLGKWPDCGIIATVQNKRYSPAVNITEHQIRGDQIAGLAAAQRYGLVNAFKILEATGNQQQYINTDGIHPTIASTAQPGYGPGADVIRDGAWPLFSAWL